MSRPDSGDRATANVLVRSGAELVEIAEQYYQRTFTAGIALVVGSVVLGIGLLPGRANPESVPRTLALLGVVLASCVVVSRRRSAVFTAIRTRPLTGAFAGVMVGMLLIADNPVYSPLWYAAAAVLALVAMVGGFRAAIPAVAVVMGSYYAGARLHDEAIFSASVPRPVLELTGLAVWALVAAALGDWLARFVLQLHRLNLPAAQAGERPAMPAERPEEDPPPRPAAPVSALASAPSAAVDAVERRERQVSRLTPRQMEVVALLRDGLRYADIAACLGISIRQVERHVRGARDRLHAATTAELVAVAVAAGLLPD